MKEHLIKKVDKIYCDELLLKQLIDENLIERLENYKTEFLEKIKSVFINGWVKIQNKNIYYNHDLKAIFPNLLDFKCGISEISSKYDEKSFVNEFSGFKGELISIREAKLLFIKNRDGNPFIKNGKIQTKTGSFNKITITCEHYINIDDGKTKLFKPDRSVKKIKPDKSDDDRHSLNIPYYLLKISEKADLMEILSTLVQLNLIPENLPLLKKEYIKIHIKDKELIFKQKLIDELLDGKNVPGLPFDKNTISRDIMSMRCKIKISDTMINQLNKKLLDCDKIRADIDSYDEKILTDPNRGHWDLWEGPPNNKCTPVNVELDFVACNPAANIIEHSIVGIDFGTKSTVIVCQKDKGSALPVPIGGQYSKNPEKKHYENPTVVEFIDIKNFLSAYKSTIGRPDTLWEDVTISHTAFDAMSGSSNEEYISFFNELKQWAGDKKREIRIRDKKNKGIDYNFYPYLSNSENAFDPIEIYAYYLGLYINNMHRGIYLDYILSYPATYEEKIKQKLRESFERGIKKSLPRSILNNAEIMKKFRVIHTASEPAAYAVCALNEYKFEPKNEEKIFYGVFDFGGGTTDFDFGIWKEADPSEKRRFDYVISHFGSNGDRYLGGENLLELLAYEIFKDKANQDKLRKAGIVFSKPHDGEPFVGQEGLVNSSQEARVNMRQLAEKLRPLWEKQEGYEKLFEKGLIKVNLSDKNGNQKVNYDLNINKEKLEKLIEDRIEKGVKSFFAALKSAFDLPKNKLIDSVKIFLAGNSSKSPVVKELFKKHIVEETKILKKTSAFFEIFPALGTDEAVKIQKGIKLEKIDTLTMPTGKTGVAFGLIKSRQGGKIKVEDQNIKDSEIKFKYFIGFDEKEKFKVILTRESEYKKWVWFIDAEHERFELYYTNLPEALTLKMHISKVTCIRCTIEKSEDKDARVYIRITGPTTIEYVVATPNGIARDNYLSIPKKIELE